MVAHPISGAKAAKQRRAVNATVVNLSEVVRQEMCWLWPGKIPLGKLTLLSGDPGLGKSFLTVDLAARVTAGRPMPDGTTCPTGSVLFLNAEDDLADTHCPRLQKAGADMTKCMALAPALPDEAGELEPLSLGRDLTVIRKALRERPDCRLVVIDPISAYLGHTDGNSNSDVRLLMYPLSQLAAEFQVAVVAVTHLNKKGSGQAMYRAMGSLAFIAAARAAWTVVRDPQDANRQLLLPVKNNLAVKATGMAYRFKAEAASEIATLEWEEQPVTSSVDEILNERTSTSVAGQIYRDSEHYVDDWLREELADGPVTREMLFHPAMRPLCISDPQTYRAAERLGVIKVKENSDYKSWFWALPEHADLLKKRVAEAKQARVRAAKMWKERQEREDAAARAAHAQAVAAEKERLEKKAAKAKKVKASRPEAKEKATKERLKKDASLQNPAESATASPSSTDASPAANTVANEMWTPFPQLPTLTEDEILAAARFDEALSKSGANFLKAFSRAYKRQEEELRAASASSAAASEVVAESSLDSELPEAKADEPEVNETDVSECPNVKTEMPEPTDDSEGDADPAAAASEPGEELETEVSGFKRPFFDRHVENMMRRIENRIARFRWRLKKLGKDLDEKEWSRFRSNLYPEERDFVDEYWKLIQDRLMGAILGTPLCEAIVENQGKWPHESLSRKSVMKMVDQLESSQLKIADYFPTDPVE